MVFFSCVTHTCVHSTCTTLWRCIYALLLVNIIVFLMRFDLCYLLCFSLTFRNPRHLLIPVLKKFHPFDVERLEISGVFQTMGL